jgi:hypothetical protein
MIPMRMKPILPATILVSAWLVVFWPLLLRGQALWYGDIGLYFAPLLHFQRAALLSGKIPLWNPLILGGTPFVGNPQAWPLYPSSGLLWLFSAERVVGLIGALHCLWAMAGAVLFLRRSGISGEGAALGALVFSLGGALVSKCQFPNMVQAASWLPWILWSIESRRALPVALCVGMSALSAHPQMTWMQVLFGAGYLLWRRPGRREALEILGGASLGLLLAAAYLLPVAEVAINSVRPSLGLRSASRFYLPWNQLPTVFLAPNFYGHPFLAPPYHGRGNFWEPCAYVGLLPLALAALIARRERFWIAAFVLSLWLALGIYGGLYALAYIALPGTKLFHDPARFLHLASFALAALAAHGFDALKLRDGGKLLLLALAALDIALFSRTLNPTTELADYGEARRTLAVRATFEDSKAIWRRYVARSGLPEDARPRDFLGSGAPNTPMLVLRPHAEGYEPVRLKRRGERPPEPTAWRIGLFLSLLGAALATFLWQNGRRDGT